MLPSSLSMPLLCVFSKQDDGLVGWSYRIPADPLMDLETYQTSFSVELDQALNGHATRMIEDTIPNHEVSERCYNAFRPCEGSHIVLSADWVSQECWRPANDSPMVWSITAPEAAPGFAIGSNYTGEPTQLRPGLRPEQRHQTN